MLRHTLPVLAIHYGRTKTTQRILARLPLSSAQRLTDSPDPAPAPYSFPLPFTAGQKVRHRAVSRRVGIIPIRD